MKNLIRLAMMAAVALSFSSCCSMFGIQGRTAGHVTETRQVKTCRSEVVTEQVQVGTGKNATFETVETRVPIFRTVTRKVRIPCEPCTRYYCPKKDCCGSTSESTIRMATAQGGVGSPHMGLIPTMKPLAP